MCPSTVISHPPFLCFQPILIWGSHSSADTQESTAPGAITVSHSAMCLKAFSARSFLQSVKIIKCRRYNKGGTLGGYRSGLSTLSPISACRDLLQSAKHREPVGFPFLHLTPGRNHYSPQQVKISVTSKLSLPLRFLPLKAASGKVL